MSRGLYSTDVSIYQIEPIGVVVPRTVEDVVTCVQIAADEGLPILPRGAGTSQGGQAIGEALVVDTSKYLRGVSDLDVEAETVRVEPGVVLDDLNEHLASSGLFFPVDVATSSRATIGGMAGNNSAGSRSIRYGVMADRVKAIDAVLSDGSKVSIRELDESWLAEGGLDGLGGAETWGAVHSSASTARDTTPRAGTNSAATPRGADGADPVGQDLPGLDRAGLDLARRMWDLHERESDELARRVPRVPRHVAGYNLHLLKRPGLNLAPLLVGSEGTLAFFTGLELDLACHPPHRVLGVCHFSDLTSALDAVQHIVELEPTAVELVDATVIQLARRNPVFRSAVERVLHGEPGAVLVVEFSGFDAPGTVASLARLEALMGDLGHPGAVVRAVESAAQAEVWGVRKAGLSIVMSMRGDEKPVSFIEDCAIPLPRLAEYAERITEVFTRNGAEGTWYAHASVGCLHVRPALNLKDGNDVGRMRTIAEEAHEIVRELGGSHSGEHGDGIIRSEFIESMLGERLTGAFQEVKSAFDARGLMNPGKIVQPPPMDDRDLFRYRPEYAARPFETVLDWTEWGGLVGAVEMCNNNGACRKSDPGTMCPSYRVTRDEKHLTRGRANALRLALTGQMGPDAMQSEAMYEVFDLCIGCKGCRRECPTGVDMARMKIEFLHGYRKKHRLGLRDRAVSHLPRFAPWAARLAPLLNLRNRSRFLRAATERLTRISAARALPKWRRDAFRNPPRDSSRDPKSVDGLPQVALFVDTFTRYFEPENAVAALEVLEAAGYDPAVALPRTGSRPLCCGRTFLNAGLVDEARAEGQRMLDALGGLADQGTTIVGLEPSCLLTLRDEIPALLPGDASNRVAERALLFEELLVRDEDRIRPRLALGPLPAGLAFVHGHCHQKAFGAFDATPKVLSWIPDLETTVIEAGCCGMAGSFGYEAEHHGLSMEMAELELLPALRKAPDDALVVADGTSCRHQIADGVGLTAVHAARVLQEALRAGS